MLKRLEVIGKTLLAWVASLLLWRPWRRRRALARLSSARSVLLVRVDNRVGEALLTTPMLEALAGRYEVDVLVHPKVARVLEGHPRVRRVYTADRRWALRQQSWDVVLNCSNWDVPSVTGALTSRLVGPRSAVVGPAIGVGGRLMDVAVGPKPGTRSERLQRLHLLSALGVPESDAHLSFREPRVSDTVRELLNQCRASPHAVINPGGRLDYRRVPASVFVTAARALAALGRRPLVTWGPGEESLAQGIVAQAPQALMAPATTLDDLAALMRVCNLTVCNNTGPMHLSVAVGAPTLGLFLHMPTDRWGHSWAPHVMLDLTAHQSDEAAMGREATAALERLAGRLAL